MPADESYKPHTPRWAKDEHAPLDTPDSLYRDLAEHAKAVAEQFWFAERYAYAFLNAMWPTVEALTRQVQKRSLEGVALAEAVYPFLPTVKSEPPTPAYKALATAMEPYGGTDG